MPMTPVAFAAPYITGFSSITDDSEVRCPHCGDSCYSHPYEVAVNRGGKLTIVAGDEPAKELQSLPVGRGSLILIRFRCECSGNYWCLKLQFHKGMTFAWSEIERKAHDNGEGDWPSEFWRD